MTTTQSKVGSEYGNLEVEMDSLGDSNEEGIKILKKKNSPMVDKLTKSKKFKWQVGLNFSTMEKSKDPIIRFTLTQGYDLKFNVFDSNRKRVQAVCQ